MPFNDTKNWLTTQFPIAQKRNETAQSKNKKLIINVKQLNENGTFRCLAADQSKPIKETQGDLRV